MEVLDNIFDVVCFLIELCVYDSYSLVGHLFNSAIISFTMKALFNFLALLNDIFEDCLSLLRVGFSLVLMNKLKAVFFRDHDSAATLKGIISFKNFTLHID